MDAYSAHIFSVAFDHDGLGIGVAQLPCNGLFAAIHVRADRYGLSYREALTGKSKLHDELQTPQSIRTLSDLQPHESHPKHHANC